MHWLLLVALACLWGPSFLMIKIGLREIPPLSMAAGRVGIAAVLMWGVMRLGGARFPKDRIFWKRFFTMGFLANALPFALLMLGESVATSALAAIFNGITPVATALIAHAVLPGERLTGLTIFGVTAGFVGILFLFLPSIHTDLGGSDMIWGMVAFLGMSTSYGASMVYSRKALRGYGKYVGPAAQLICATIVLVPVALIFEWDRLRVPGPESFGALLWLAVIATALAYAVYYRLLERAGATFISLVTLFLPPMGVLLGVLFLEESVGWNALVGCGLILLGVGFVRNNGK